MSTYWLSWYHVADDSYYLETIRPYYITGSKWVDGPEGEIRLDCLCLAVDARSVEEAKAYVHGLYEQPAELQWRFCHVHTLGWNPPFDRFPPIAP